MTDFLFLEIELLNMGKTSIDKELDLNSTSCCSECYILYKFLENERKDKIQRIRIPKERCLRLYASAFVKLYISSRTDISPEKLIFSYGKNGKPYFENSPLKFNFSHTENAIAFAFSDSEIGIDVEKVEEIDLKIAERFFTDIENKYVFENILPDEQENKLFLPTFDSNDENAVYKRFFTVWTRKEAFLKQSGKGIALSLDKVNTLDPEKKIKTYVIGGYIISVSSNDNEIHLKSISKEEIISMAENYVKANPLQYMNTDEKNRVE